MNPTTIKTITLSTRDSVVLRSLISGLPVKSESLQRLRDELDRAVVLEPLLLPPTVVGLGSRVALLDLDTGEREDYTIVLPAHADAALQRVSVLAPIGAALIGYREGDDVEWPTPGGVRRLKLLRVSREA